VRFLVDTQLPKALSLWLSEHGHKAEHVLDVSLGQSKDTPVWRYAQQNGAVIVTKDEDFAEWVRRGRPGPAVVWLRIGNSSKRALLAWLEPLMPAIVRQLEQGDRLVEVR
jgi:predicted nuclease of predicted toxin-antitoxin system